jgi:uncharacterized membrane protein YeaQ/YmgE (transglycosylase-associated protein family)
MAGRWRCSDYGPRSLRCDCGGTHPGGGLSSPTLPGQRGQIRDEGYGVIGTIIAGIVGAVVGGFVLGLITGDDWTTGINIPTLFAAVVGAVIVVLVWKMVARRGTT